MSDDATALTTLAPGHPVRARTARVLLLVALAAATFTAFGLASTQLSPVRHHSPWQNDPYDLVVSFTIFAVPGLVAVGGLRAQLCRREQPLPAVRLHGLVRAARLTAALVTLTAACDWAAVALHAERALWNPTTWALIAALAVVTALGVGSLLALHALPSGCASEDDWLAELATLGELAAAELPAGGSVARSALRDLERALDSRLGPRRHPWAAAAVMALAAGIAVAGMLAWREAQPLSLLAIEAVVFTLGALGLLSVANAALGLLPLPAARPIVVALRVALTCGCLAVPLGVGLRDQICALLGRAGSVDSPGGLWAIIGGALVAGAVAGLLVAWPRHALR